MRTPRWRREATHEPRDSTGDERVAPRRLRPQLADLKMPGALEALDDILRRCDSGQVSSGDAIEQLLGAHIQLRNARRLQTAMRSARLPVVKTLADFDFSFQPSVKREQMESLQSWAFSSARRMSSSLAHRVLEEHFALSLAVAAAEHGRRVYFTTLADLRLPSKRHRAPVGSPIGSGRSCFPA